MIHKARFSYQAIISFILYTPGSRTDPNRVATSGAGTAYPSGPPEFTSGLCYLIVIFLCSAM